MQTTKPGPSCLEDSFDEQENGSLNEIDDEYVICEISSGLDKTHISEKGSQNAKSGKVDIDDMDFEVVDDQKEAKKSWVLKPKSQSLLDEWKKVSKFNKVVEGTNIMPTKTFMTRRKWTNHTSEEEQFKLIEFIKEFKSENNKKIGAIIDINASDSGYYNWDYLYRRNKDLLKGIDYRKVKFRYDEVSNKATLNKVYDVLNKNLFKDHIVIIHCTRGINRTGHALCYFLCKRLEMTPTEAIKKFEEARGYSIQSKKVLEDLFDRFG